MKIRCVLAIIMGCIIGYISSLYVPDNDQYLCGFIVGTAIQVIVQIIK